MSLSARLRTGECDSHVSSPGRIKLFYSIANCWEGGDVFMELVPEEMGGVELWKNTKKVEELLKEPQSIRDSIRSHKLINCEFLKHI